MTNSGLGTKKGSAATGPQRCPRLGPGGGMDGPTATSGSRPPRAGLAIAPGPLAVGLSPSLTAHRIHPHPLSQRLKDGVSSRPGDTGDAGPAELTFYQNASTKGCGRNQPAATEAHALQSERLRTRRPISALMGCLQNEPRGCAMSRSEPRRAN